MSDQSKQSISRRQMLKLLGVGSAGWCLLPARQKPRKPPRPTEAGITDETAGQPATSQYRNRAPDLPAVLRYR